MGTDYFHVSKIFRVRYLVISLNDVITHLGDLVWFFQDIEEEE